MTALSRKQKPLYLQIRNILRDRILHGVYPLGTNIPSEPQLEQEFQVSKITVRNAIQELVLEGYLEKGSGKGTKVVRNTSSSKLSKSQSFTEILVEEGHRIVKRLLGAEKVANEEGSERRLLFGETCLRVERLYVLDDAPYIHYTHYLSDRRGELDLSDLEGQSLYGLLEEQSIELRRFRDRFAVESGPAHVAGILQVPPDQPLLKRVRRAYDESGELIELSEGYYNTAIQGYLVNYDV